MASKKEIDKNLKIALKEIGEVKPWFSKEFNGWIFSHKLYPDVECFGNTLEEVIKDYPLYLREFISQRLDQNITEKADKETKGRGGKRLGAGRPKRTKHIEKTRVYVPTIVANEVSKFFDPPNTERAVTSFQQLVAKSRH